MALRSKKSSRSGIRKHFARFSEATDNPKALLLRYAIIFLLVLTGLFHFRAAFFAQLSQNQGSEMAAFSHSLTNPDALAKMAREDHLWNADLQSAEFLYKKALENFILHLPSWLGIAEVMNDQGKINEAIEVLEFIQNRFKNGEHTTWSKTLLASTLGQERILTENLIWLLNNSSPKKKDVFALASLTWEEPDVLMNKFGKDFYGDILQKYIRNNELDKTLMVWDKIVQSGSIEQTVAIQYINYLLNQKAFSLAAEVWSETRESEDPLLYNGNFAQPILGTAFGWRMSRPAGMSSKTGNDGNGLEITFDGTENVALQLSQTIPLNPGEYSFNGSIETDGLSTDQLPFWQIQGVQCIGLNEQSQMILPDQHDTDFAIEFIVPDNCELIQIALNRKKSFHFDNKIAGMMTINNLKIQLRKAASSSPVQPSAHIPDTQAAIQKSQSKKEPIIFINKLQIQP